MKWTVEEIQYLKENYSKLQLKKLQLNRSVSSIQDKACTLNLAGYGRWTDKDLEYLMDSWGSFSMDTIAKNLNRTRDAVQQKARKSGLGRFLEAGEYVSLNQLICAIFGIATNTGRSYKVNQWAEKGLPVKKKKVKNCRFNIIYLQDWWDWAEANSTIIDFSKLEPMVLGEEPKWLDDQRKADIQRRYFKMSPWTSDDDYILKKLLNEYRYTYRVLSLKIRRTEGAIKRRMMDLNIKARPIKMDNHNPWTTEETKVLIDLYFKGHTPNTMANYIDRSSQACSGKVERLIKEGILAPRSMFRSSC